MVDWVKTFEPDTPLMEILARGTVMYLALYVMLRVVLKRESGATGVNDMLVIVLIADAAQNGMADDYHSVTDGLLLVGVIIGWSYTLNYIAYRWPAAGRIIRPRPLPLVRDGRILHQNLRGELVTEQELRGQLREQGIDSFEHVRDVWMEADGRFSVTTRDQHRRPAQPKEQF